MHAAGGDAEVEAVDRHDASAARPVDLAQPVGLDHEVAHAGSLPADVDTLHPVAGRGQDSGLSTGTRRSARPGLRPARRARSPASGRTAPRRAARRAALHERHHLGDGDVAAQLLAQRGDAGVADAARHEAVVPGEVHVAVQREAVHGHAPADPDADRGDLALGPSASGLQPDPAAARDARGGDAEVGAHADQRLLEAAHVVDDEHVVGQPHDRVADQLARAVEGDLAAAVDVDDRGAVGRVARAARCACRPCRPGCARAAARCRAPRRRPRRGPRAGGPRPRRSRPARRSAPRRPVAHPRG